MIQCIEGVTANEVWKKAALLLMEQKNTLAGRNGNVFELLHTFIQLKIQDKSGYMTEYLQ